MATSHQEDCPVCLSSEIQWLSPYGQRRFLSCHSLYLCRRCEVVFARDLPASETLDAYYSGGGYHGMVSDPYENDFVLFSAKLGHSRVELLKKTIDLALIKNVLDVGAGNGEFGKAMSVHHPELSYDAVEPDDTVRKGYGTWVRKRFRSLEEVNGNTYDLIVLNHVLEHSNDPIRFLTKIGTLSRPGGCVLIDVPNRDYAFKPSVAPHLFFWNRASLHVALERTDYQVLFCDTAGMPWRQARRFFGGSSLQRSLDLWSYASAVNRFASMLSLPRPFDLFRRFHAYEYGGERQWLRCVARSLRG